MTRYVDNTIRHSVILYQQKKKEKTLFGGELHNMVLIKNEKD